MTNLIAYVAMIFPGYLLFEEWTKDSVSLWRMFMAVLAIAMCIYAVRSEGERGLVGVFYAAVLINWLQ